jgi:hypothetical protein
MKVKQRVTRTLVVEETYLVDVDDPMIAKLMVKRAEERGQPYAPAQRRIVRTGRMDVVTVPADMKLEHNDETTHAREAAVEAKAVAH